MSLAASELLVEYVLDDPNSYALAVTRNSVHRYTLPSRDLLEQEAAQYRSTLKQEKTDPALGQRLYDGLLGGIPELKDKHDLIVVPDGKLHLLPFSALINSRSIRFDLPSGHESCLREPYSTCSAIDPTR